MIITALPGRMNTNWISNQVITYEIKHRLLIRQNIFIIAAFLGEPAEKNNKVLICTAHAMIHPAIRIKRIFLFSSQNPDSFFTLLPVAFYD